MGFELKDECYTSFVLPLYRHFIDFFSIAGAGYTFYPDWDRLFVLKDKVREPAKSAL